jgi:hypothetical protein
MLKENFNLEYLEITGGIFEAWAYPEEIVSKANREELASLEQGLI